MSDRSREFQAQGDVRMAEIEHRKAFSDLAFAVYEAEAPPGGWPPAIEEKLVRCREAATRMRDATRALDRVRNRG